MNRIFSVVCLFALFFSCNSSDENPLSQESEPNFYALTVGNAWVYKNYSYNSTTETYDDSGVIDSVSIIGEELISGNNYFELRTWTTGNDDPLLIFNPNGEKIEFVRDSLGYLIDESGAIKFTNNDFSERLVSEESWGTIFEQLGVDTVIKEVEAGSFECLEIDLWAFITNTGEIGLGRQQRLYSDSIGLIYETYSFVSSAIPAAERRLDTYLIN